jgi:hypothetical protein
MPSRGLDAADPLGVLLFLKLGLGCLFDRGRNHPSLRGKNGLVRLRRPCPARALLASIVRALPLIQIMPVAGYDLEPRPTNAHSFLSHPRR